MMLDILNEYFKLRIEFFAILDQRLQLGQKHLYLSMLLDPFKNDFLQFLIPFCFNFRIENRLFDVGMYLKFGVNPLKQSGMIIVLIGLEFLKKLRYFCMIIFQ